MDAQWCWIGRGRNLPSAYRRTALILFYCDGTLSFFPLFVFRHYNMWRTYIYMLHIYIHKLPYVGMWVVYGPSAEHFRPEQARIYHRFYDSQTEFNYFYSLYVYTFKIKIKHDAVFVRKQ